MKYLNSPFHQHLNSPPTFKTILKRSETWLKFHIAFSQHFNCIKWSRKLWFMWGEESTLSSKSGIKLNRCKFREVDGVILYSFIIMPKGIQEVKLKLYHMSNVILGKLHFVDYKSNSTFFNVTSIFSKLWLYLLVTL